MIIIISIYHVYVTCDIGTNTKANIIKRDIPYPKQHVFKEDFHSFATIP
jgi:hypothetical protein